MLKEFKKKCIIYNNNKQLSKLELNIIKNDFFHWLENWCVTQDEHDRKNPFKMIPVYNYFRYLINAATESEILLVPKSRQIMVTWIFVAWMTYLTLYENGLLNIMFSKRGRDADILIKRRANVIYDFIPNSLKPEVTLYKSHNSKIETNNILGSKLWAFPQGADKIRSNTPSNVFFDEIAFMNEAAETYGAAKPAIYGGGHLYGVSSAKRGSFFEELLRMAMKPLLENIDKEAPFCWKTILELSYKLEKMGKPDILKRPMRGVIDYYSEEENIRVIWLHYTAQKLKADKNWKRRARKGWNKAVWEQEMEIDFSVETGKLVFPGLPSQENITNDFDIPNDWLRGRSIDVGYDQPTACTWFAIEPQTGDIYIYREYYIRGESTRVHKKNILERSLEDLNGEEDVNYIYFLQLIDPQTQAHDQASGAQLSSILNQYMEDQDVEIDGEIYNAHMYLTPAGKKPVAGIFRLRDLMKHSRIHIFKSCNLTIKEIENYVDPTDNLDRKLKPKCKNDHLIDTLLFVMEALPPLYGEGIKDVEIKSDVALLREQYLRQKHGRGIDGSMGSIF